MINRSIRSLCFGILLFAVVMVAFSASSFAEIGLVVRFGPPPLPVYEQPPCPEEGYLWTPGYWSFDNDYDDYYWVPGTWVLAPEPGYFWTPGYWGWGGNGFLFHEGYWGPRVGYYGGINYGYGYFGEGYQGGRWDNGRFFYNRAVNNVNETVIRNVYVTNVVETNRTRVSYNGGDGGVNARPRAEDEAAERERHVGPVAAQNQQVQSARGNPQLRASENHGKPPVAATPRPGDFNRGAVPAKEAGGAYNPPPNRGGAQQGNGGNRNAEQSNGNVGDRNTGRQEPNQPVARPDDGGNKPKAIYHPNDLPARQAHSDADNAQQNQKYQQQMQKMQQKEDQQRQKLQEKQDRDHQKLEQQKSDDARKQQVEQRHQQQTEKLQQREQKQEQKMESRQPKPQGHPEQARPEPPQKENQPH